ncbi:MAG TPA: ThiF family adenylyltransferase [Thermoleophilaceae bacterium]|nr:ThiF family adenylyltransferase [Thermoleophilaceae bacterium]
MSGAVGTEAPDRARSEADFYRELTTRNRGVVGAEAQERLRTATVLVAGCGSIGGAAVEPLARLGARNLLLADPGEYELNNLNRQNATVDDVGRNKAEVAADRVSSVNPHARVRAFPEGVTEATVDELTRDCDVVVDGVDVTTMSGLRAKYVLHERAAARRLPLFTGWDMAGAQYVRHYDYRRISEPFDGAIRSEDLDRLGMWQLLKRLVPARYVPVEMLTMGRENLDDPDFTFPQLVYAADLFGALAAHLVVQLLTGQPVREHIYVDLHQQARPAARRALASARRPLEAVRAIARLRMSS